MTNARTVMDWPGRNVARTRRGLVEVTVQGTAPQVPGAIGTARLIERATTNLFANPSVEVDMAGIVGFGGGDVVERTTDQAWDGVASARFTRGASVASSFIGFTGISLAAASVYCITARVRVFGGFAPADIRLQSVDMAGVTQTYRRVWSAADGEGDWVRVETCIETASAVSGSVRLRTGGSAPPAGGGFYVDGIQLEAGAWPTSFVAGARAAAGVSLPAAQVGAQSGGVCAWLVPGWGSSSPGPHTVLHRAGGPDESLRLACEAGSWVLQSIAGGVSTTVSLPASHARGDQVLLAAGWTPRELWLSDGTTSAVASRDRQPPAIARNVPFEVGRRQDTGLEALDGVIGPVVWLDAPPDPQTVRVAAHRTSPPPWLRGPQPSP